MLRKILAKHISVVLLILLSTCLSEASSRFKSTFTLNDGLPSDNIHQIF